MRDDREAGTSVHRQRRHLHRDARPSDAQLRAIIEPDDVPASQCTVGPDDRCGLDAVGSVGDLDALAAAEGGCIRLIVEGVEVAGFQRDQVGRELGAV